jgi:hypothetical protein
MTNWETRFSFGDDAGLPRRPLASVTLPAPPANVLAPVPLTERVHRMMNPAPRVELPFDEGYRNPAWQPPKADEQQPAAVETSEEALPPVIPVPERDLGSEVSELLESTFKYLDQFAVVEKPDDFERGYQNPLDTSRPAPQPKSDTEIGFETRKTALLDSLHAWADSFTHFLSDHRSWRTETIRNEYQEAWAACKQQDAIVAGIVAEGQQAVAEMRNLKQAQAKARLLAEGHVEAEPDLNDLPSQADLDRWRAENVRLKAAWKVADEAVSAEISRQRSLRLRYEREVIKRRALRQVERSLRLKLGGEDVKDPGTGLVGAPEL